MTNLHGLDVIPNHVPITELDLLPNYGRSSYNIYDNFATENKTVHVLIRGGEKSKWTSYSKKNEDVSPAAVDLKDYKVQFFYKLNKQ